MKVLNVWLNFITTVLRLWWFGVFQVYVRWKYKWQVSRYPTRKHYITTLTHAKNLRKIYGNFQKSSEIFGKIRIFGNASKPFLKRLYDFWKFSGNLWKCSEIFRNFRKLQKRFKIIFEEFYDSFLIFEKFAYVKSIGADFGKSSKGR